MRCDASPQTTTQRRPRSRSAWLIHKPNVVAIPGASSIDQLHHNVEAADLDLSDAEAEELTAESDRFAPVGIPATARGLLRARRRSA